jgi:hypothetical protein
MTTPFDTTRLDEECDRIAKEHPWTQKGGDVIFPSEVSALLLGKPMPSGWNHINWRDFAIVTYNMVRRPKMVPA